MTCVKSMLLTRAQFADNLKRGTEALREDIARYCWNQLPEGDRYFVLLNSSFDGNPLAPGEHIFPDHATAQTDVRVAWTAEEVVERLWRNGKIPEWIDITPYEADADFLYSELRCCGRFTDEEVHLYHKQEGYPPFHKFGPIFPVGYRDLEQDGKFDLHCYRDRKPNA
jgi:hypothetical protein